jgi:hypothetical protein
VEDEDRPQEEESQAAAVDTPPADAAPPRPVVKLEATDTRAVQVTSTEKQQACPHPVAEVVTLTGGIAICNHCYDLIHFLPDERAA